MKVTATDISPVQLVAGFDEVLEAIARGSVFRVIEDGECSFVLGSEALCGRVLGLVDPEYGWPVTVRRSDVRTIADVRPGPRRHPFVTDGSSVVAVAVSCAEWAEIERRSSP